MKRFAPLAAFLALACLLAALPAWAEPPMEHTVQGRYLRSETGDYNHAVFEVKGQELSLFCHYYFTELLDAIQPSEPMTIVFTSQDQDIPEAGGTVRIDVLDSVTLHDSWDPSTLYRIEMLAPEQ